MAEDMSPDRNGDNEDYVDGEEEISQKKEDEDPI